MRGANSNCPSSSISRIYQPPHARAEALRFSTEDARAPFDFASGPLLRAKLVRLYQIESICSF